MKKQAQNRHTFYPDESLKHQIIRGIIESSKLFRFLETVQRIIIVATIGGSALYIFTNLVLNSWNIVYSDGESVNDYGDVFVAGLAIFVIGAAVTLIVKLALKYLLQKQIDPRYDEQLEFSANELRYYFRNKKLKTDTERIIVTIPFTKGIQSYYDARLRKLVFRGNINFRHRKNTKEGVIAKHEEKSKIIIYDYWDPSLHYILQKNNIDFIEGV